MRLLFLSNFFPPAHLGGMELRCHELVEHLRERGHTVQVLTSRFGVQADIPPENHVIRELFLQADIYHYHPLDFFLKRRSRERTNKHVLRQALDCLKPDLVFVWGMWNLSPSVPYWAEQWMPGRVVYSIAHYWLTDPDAHVAYWQQPAGRKLTTLLKAPFARLALRSLQREGYPPPLQLEHVVCVSRFVRDTMVELGALPATARVIYSGIDPGPFLEGAVDWERPPSEPLCLVYVGGLLQTKGVHTAIEAMGLLKQAGRLDMLRLTLFGDGHPEYVTKLRTLAEAWGVSRQVEFAGRVPRADLPKYLGQSDIFLFCSTWDEPLARTVMEAMAVGLLVVGTRVGGQAEMLFDGENGLAFQPGDAQGLADCISRAMDDHALQRRLAQEGQKMVLERFTLNRMVDEYETWLEGIAA